MRIRPPRRLFRLRVGAATLRAHVGRVHGTLIRAAARVVVRDAHGDLAGAAGAAAVAGGELDVVDAAVAAAGALGAQVDGVGPEAGGVGAGVAVAAAAAGWLVLAHAGRLDRGGVAV